MGNQEGISPGLQLQDTVNKGMNLILMIVSMACVVMYPVVVKFESATKKRNPSPISERFDSRPIPQQMTGNVQFLLRADLAVVGLDPHPCAC
jgi:hypothetical protein